MHPRMISGRPLRPPSPRPSVACVKPPQTHAQSKRSAINGRARQNNTDSEHAVCVIQRVPSTHPVRSPQTLEGAAGRTMGSAHPGAAALGPGTKMRCKGTGWERRPVAPEEGRLQCQAWDTNEDTPAATRPRATLVSPVALPHIRLVCSPALGAHKLVSLSQHQQVRQRLLLGVQACRVAGDVERGMPSLPRTTFTHSGASLPCSGPHS